jgi:hypothetical protein
LITNGEQAALVTNLCVTEATSPTGAFWETQHKLILKLLAVRYLWVVSAHFHAQAVSFTWITCRYVQSDVRLSNISRNNGDVRPIICAAAVCNFDTIYSLVCVTTSNAVIGKYSVHGSTVPWLPSDDIFPHEQLLTLATIPFLEHECFVLTDLSSVPVYWGTVHGVQTTEDDESGETQQSFGFHDNTSELLQFLLASFAAEWSPGLVRWI